MYGIIINEEVINMSYKVLYRKYRPHDFNDLYGQDSIKRLLIDSINNNKLSHAYLFSGPRGTGKTSTAKLFTKTINCENVKNGIPCNKCSSCINYEQSPDIIEIDAASNNGVDEIRDLRDNAKVLPTYSKYKIYIIDEVHMLSQSAWNAFLKILEEPPKHVIFILATTELQKIPITILSRCQRFSFQRISINVIAENILRISKIEKIKITDEAANYIALLSDGGMRDALSLLDQLSKENIEITKELVQETFGILSENDIDDIFKNLENGNIKYINDIFAEYENKGLDVNILISRLLNYIYQLEIDLIKSKNSIFDVEELKKLSFEISNCYNKKDALVLIKIILLSYIRNNDTIFDNTTKIISREIIDKTDNLKIDSNIDEKYSNKIQSEIQENIDNLIKIRVNNSFVNANKTEKEKFKKIWENFINIETSKNNIDMLSLIEDISIEVVSPTNVLFSHKSKSTSILFNESLTKIEDEFNIVLKQKEKFICLSEDEWKKEKKKYIENKEKKYEYMDEPNNMQKSILSEEAINLFGEDVVEIN